MSVRDFEPVDEETCMIKGEKTSEWLESSEAFDLGHGNFRLEASPTAWVEADDESTADLEAWR